MMMLVHEDEEESAACLEFSQQFFNTSQPPLAVISQSHSVLWQKPSTVSERIVVCSFLLSTKKPHLSIFKPLVLVH